MVQLLQHVGVDEAAVDTFRPTLASIRIVMMLAASGTTRFSQIKVSIGIAAKTLSANLRELERNGLVHRRAYATIPPRVEYSLTEIGEDLAQLSAAWEAWLERSRPRIEAARGVFEDAGSTARPAQITSRHRDL